MTRSWSKVRPTEALERRKKERRKKEERTKKERRKKGERKKSMQTNLLFGVDAGIVLSSTSIVT